MKAQTSSGSGPRPSIIGVWARAQTNIDVWARAQSIHCWHLGLSNVISCDITCDITQAQTKLLMSGSGPTLSIIDIQRSIKTSGPGPRGSGPGPRGSGPGPRGSITHTVHY